MSNQTFANADTLPLFQYRDTNGQLQTLDSGVNPLPRVIREYRIDHAKWAAAYPFRAPTVDDILSLREPMQAQAADDRSLCANCLNPVGLSATRAGRCRQDACITQFRALLAANAQKIEIRDAGAMGKGVFAKEDIAEDVILGEYLGELLPPPDEDAPIPDPNDVDPYEYEINALEGEELLAGCTAIQFGNWTRFINHRCNITNLEAADGHYGGRRAVIFTTTRAIAKDEQLFIGYGRGYFEQRGMRCVCDAYRGPHYPPGIGLDGRIVMRKSGRRFMFNSGAQRGLASAGAASNTGRRTVDVNDDEIRLSIRISLADTAEERQRQRRPKRVGPRGPRRA